MCGHNGIVFAAGQLELTLRPSMLECLRGMTVKTGASGPLAHLGNIAENAKVRGESSLSSRGAPRTPRSSGCIVRWSPRQNGTRKWSVVFVDDPLQAIL